MNLELYRSGASFLHAFDARAKLLLLVPLVVCFFLPQPWQLLLIFTAAIMTVVAIALGPRDLLQPLKAVGPLLILICLLTPPFHRDGPVILRVFGLALLTSDGVRETAVMLTALPRNHLRLFRGPSHAPAGRPCARACDGSVFPMRHASS